jgi:hypothetical protein
MKLCKILKQHLILSKIKQGTLWSQMRFFFFHNTLDHISADPILLYFSGKPTSLQSVPYFYFYSESRCCLKTLKLNFIYLDDLQFLVKFPFLFKLRCILWFGYISPTKGNFFKNNKFSEKFEKKKKNL